MYPQKTAFAGCGTGPPRLSSSLEPVNSRREQTSRTGVFYRKSGQLVLRLASMVIGDRIEFEYLIKRLLNDCRITQITAPVQQ
ncbi:hypothetical protein A0H81_14403 [Grifola frondosa]|uniref:Uncharacterized protein n=1 Tax=Grifola frondosa TaxID=5627 RepID=A0A1C7LM52_GRIFR|nr:hypothetical protein A0H81_14403 [Grifola frondosa]